MKTTKAKNQMIFTWTDTAVNFMADAYHHSNYCQQLVAKMLPYLGPDSVVWDVGCGPGYLSLALAPHVRRVVAMDLSPVALKHLQRECATQGIDNITTLTGDALTMELPAEAPDAAIFSYFGSAQECLSISRRGGVKRLFIMARDRTRPATALGPASIPHLGTVETLTTLGLPHLTEHLSLELGQPLTTREAVSLYLQVFNLVDEDPAEIQERLVPGPSAEFPWYLPLTRNLTFTTLAGEDIL